MRNNFHFPFSIFQLRDFTKKLVKHPFFAGSLVMVVGSNLYNFGQFVYHFLAGRFLGKVFYGDLAAIISILGLVAIIQNAIGLTIVKFVAAEKSGKAVSNLTKWVFWWALWAGLAAAAFTLALSPFLIKFLNIQQPVAIYLLGPTLLFFVLANTGRSVLQGILAFGRYVISLLSEISLKLILTVVFVLFLFTGYAVFGAMVALFLGILASSLITVFFLKDFILGPKGDKPDIVPLIKYSLPVFIQGVALTSMYTADLLLVKHFFSPEQAGIYASLAVLGRVVFFGASPITHVMFPLVARRHSHGERYHNILYLSVFLILSISAFVVLFYYLFPELAIGILYGAEFLAGAPLLWWFGVFMGLVAFAMLLIQFYLSVGKTRIVWLFVLGAILQIVLIWFIHPDLLTVIKLSILSAALLVFSLLVYFPYHDRG